MFALWGISRSVGKRAPHLLSSLCAVLVLITGTPNCCFLFLLCSVFAVKTRAVWFSSLPCWKLAFAVIQQPLANWQKQTHNVQHHFMQQMLAHEKHTLCSLTDLQSQLHIIKNASTQMSLYYLQGAAGWSCVPAYPDSWCCQGCITSAPEPGSLS